MMYLDSGATTPPHPGVIDEYVDMAINEWYNPSTIYSGGVEAKKVLEDARRLIANTIMCDDVKDVIFTSTGTEGNNIIIQGFFNRIKKGQDAVFITSQIEHPSVLNVAMHIEQTMDNVHVYYLPVNEDGVVDWNDLEGTIKASIQDDGISPENILTSIQWANSEIGTCQNVVLLGQIAHKYHTFFHTDAVQLFPHMRITANDLEYIDAFTVSGHKFGALRGSAFIYVNSNLRTHISPILFGGGHENGLRPGTENVAGCHALAQRVKWLYKEADDDSDRFWVDKIVDALNQNNIKHHINGTCGIPILSLTIPGVNASSLLSLLSNEGIYISAGSACHSYISEPSHVLKAIGLSDEEARCTIRICWNEEYGDSEIDYLLEWLVYFIKVLQRG